MINEQQFLSLLQRMEDETLDFKARGYDLTDEGSRFSFVKDVLCMANTPRDTTSFIVLGVKKYADGSYDLPGIETHLDEADLQSQFTTRTAPIPDFTYLPILYCGKRFGIITIRPTRMGPYLPIVDYKGMLRKSQTYFRRGSKNDTAMLPEDIARILTWFGKVPSNLVYNDGDPSWERLLEELQDFDAGRHYILIASSCPQDPYTDLGILGQIPWVGVFDFDPDSDSQGLLSVVRIALESRRSIHRVTGLWRIL